MVTSSCSIILLVLVFTAFTYSFYLPKRANAFIPRDGVTDPKKRPFCNAFTGCGKKRSNLPAYNPLVGEPDESLDSLLELSAEPAVEDLSRQIMSEAKLWEAIQEANMELSRRRQESSESMEDLGPYRKASNGKCSMPPCYI